MKLPSKILEKRYYYKYNDFIKSDIKIVSLSDTHITYETLDKEIDLMIKAISKENPNYICILGDIIDFPQVLYDEKNRNKVKKLFSGLSKIAKVFIIFGNHDYINLYKKDLYDNYDDSFWNDINNLKNVKIINDEKVELEDITICGYFEKKDVYKSKKNSLFYEDFSSQKFNTSNNKPKVLIMHSARPLEIKKNKELVKDFDIILCGHYHNGCVPSFLNKVVPKNRGIITPDKKIFRNNIRGIINLTDKTSLILNGGWLKIRHNLLIHVLDNLCNRQIDVTIISKDKKNSNKTIIKKEFL